MKQAISEALSVLIIGLVALGLTLGIAEVFKSAINLTINGITYHED